MSMRFIGESLTQDQGIYMMRLWHGKDGLDAYAMPDSVKDPLGLLAEWAAEHRGDPAADRLADKLSGERGRIPQPKDMVHHNNLGEALASVRGTKVHEFSDLRLSECPGTRIDGSTAGASWLLNIASDGGAPCYAFWEQNATPAGHHYGELLDIARDFRGNEGADSPHREMAKLVRQAEVRNRVNAKAPQKKPAIGGR